VIAYLFWHAPRRQEVDRDSYEQAAEGLHRSLRRSRPAGLLRSALLRAGSVPWLEGQGWYEDWYLVEDFCALGVLNEAAVAVGHRSAHDQIARRYGEGAGGVYKLIEGGCDSIDHSLAIWVSRPAGAAARGLGDMLGDGMDHERASLWRRQMVLGPGPEYCLLAGETPAGVSATRLPTGWKASVQRREVIFDG
jgi:hypothetical protein